MSTYSVGARDGTGTQATAAWLFGTGGAAVTPGRYTPSAYDGAMGATEADFILTDLRDYGQWLSDGLTGTITVYDAGDGAIDVVWHNLGLATVFDDVGVSTEGWVTCTQ